jgi:TonB family protein
MFYLSLAVGIHAVGLWIAHSEQWLHQKTPQTPAPIEFINIESSSTESPPSTERRAQRNAVAARNPNREQTPQARQTRVERTTLREITSQFANSPDTPDASVIPVLPQPSPVPLLSPVPPSSFSQVPRVEAAGQEAMDQLGAALAPILPAPSTPGDLPSVAPRASAPLPEPDLVPQSSSPSAAQLGAPITASAILERQGLSQLNSNQAGDGSSVDAVQDEVWGNYLSMLNQMVSRNWQRVSGMNIRRTRIRFRVDRQGNLTEISLLQPSGDTAADEAAIQAIRAAAPFAPLPQNASEEVLIVNFTFTQGPFPSAP